MVDQSLLLCKLVLVFLLLLLDHLKLALDMHQRLLSLTLGNLELLLVVLPLVLEMGQFYQFHFLFFMDGGLLRLKHNYLIFLCFQILFKRLDVVVLLLDLHLVDVQT
jgi:hypothetical protein